MGTHYKGSSKEVNALNTYLKLIRAAESVSSRINASLIENKLTGSQFNLLDSLYHLGPLSQKEIGNKLLKTGGNITMIVDNLEKRKLVTRERGVIDRRYFTVHLTNKGKELIQKLFPKKLKAIVDEINILGEDEQLELQRLCKLLGMQNYGQKD